MYSNLFCLEVDKIKRSIKIVKVDSNYCNFLRVFDSKVPYNEGRKELRPFIGVLFYIKGCEYYAPLTSPKDKHKKIKSSLDFIKIQNGDYGAINLNNMIPVTKKNYTLFDLNKKTSDSKEKKHIELMRNQMIWLSKHKIKLYNQSKILYELYLNNELPYDMKARCCNFPLLEEKCRDYNK